jgi:hypothetical protein
MREACRDYATCPKEEVAEVFNSARGIAETSVQKLEEIIKNGNYVAMQSEAMLLAELENESSSSI